MSVDLGKHLADGEVMIVQEAGSEGLRYVTGSALAFNNLGEVRVVSLEDICFLAKQLGPHVTDCATSPAKPSRSATPPKSRRR